MNGRLRLGTRGSPLAQAQANLAAEALHARGMETELVIISTRGDNAATAPLGELGPGAFASALEEALIADAIDVAVHSAKDLTGDEQDALPIVAFLPRADPRDAWCGEARSFGDISVGARVGTSSLRRIAALRRLRPDLVMVPIRGNVQTRLDRRGPDDLDGVVLAACGLERVGLESEIGFRFPVEMIVPEAGQGAIALQTRAGEEHSIGWVNDDDTFTAVAAERLVTRGLGGGCRVPVAAHAHRHDQGWRLTGWIGAPDGTREIRLQIEADDPLEVHDQLLEDLLEAGGSELLKAGV